MEKQFVLVPMELMQKLGAYLGTKPYSEVSGIIGDLSQCKLALLPEEKSDSGESA